MIFFRKTYSYNYPIVVYIKPTNICNLHCPGCPTGVGIPSNREKNTLKLKQFKFFLDQIKDFVYSINFSNWGEPLLHPDILSMIEYAHRNHIRTCMDTNFNINISEKKAESMIKSGLDLVTVSLDGFLQKTYGKYRRGGKVELVKRNIKTLARMKERLNSDTPEIEIQFLIFSHNINEVDAVKNFAKQAGAKFTSKYGRRPGIEFDPHPDEPYAPEYGDCIFLWTITTLNSDNGLAPCCLSYYKKDDFGELTSDFNFKRFWNCENYIYSRALFSRMKKVRRSASNVLKEKKLESPCLRCPYYTKKDKRYGQMGIL